MTPLARRIISRILPGLTACLVASAAEAPIIRGGSVIAGPGDSLSFEFEGAAGDSRIFGIQVSTSPDGGAGWEIDPGATLAESAPGLFKVATVRTGVRPTAFYRIVASPPSSARLEINEVMSDNTAVFPDATKAYWDWIEIHNPNDVAVNLAGYALTDDPLLPDQWVFPDLLIQPDGYLVVYASGLDRRLPGGELHTNFRISSGGETLQISGPDGSVVDRVDVSPLATNESYGRKPTDITGWEVYAKAQTTPGLANSVVSIGPPLPKPEFPDGEQFLPAGASVAITLQSSTPGSTVRFTTNGNPVTVDSPVYTGAFQVGTNVVVRARAFLGTRISDEAMRTYLFGVTHDLPVVSLAAPASNFEFKNGFLFGMGSSVINAAGQVLQSYPFSGSNAWKDREIEVAIEFFETDRKARFRQRVGMSVYGGWGSRGYPQKSVALFARQKYGDGSMSHRIFPDRSSDSYESIVLRNSGNDNQSTHQTAPRAPITQFGQTYTYGSYFVNGNFTLMRDAMEQRLLAGTGLDTQAYRPAVVYINGEYWGIYNLREKLTDQYIYANHGFAKGEIDLIEGYGTALAGDSTVYSALRSFVSSKDMRLASTYNTIATQYLDIDNFIDYHLAVIYFQNFDIGNIKCWRARKGDGRFRWIVYDQDYGFNLWPPAVYIPAMARDYADYDNMFKFYTSSSGSGTGWPNEGGRTLLLRRMLLNDTFKKRFIQRCADLLNSNFREDHVVEVIQSMAAVIRPEIGRHLQRWSWAELEKRGYGKPYKAEYAPFVRDTWETNLNVLVDFAQKRPDRLRQDCTNYFKLQKGFTRLTVDVVPAGAGGVVLNSTAVLPAAMPWSGTYFRDYPVTLAAVARPGFRFVEWTGDGVSTNAPRWDLAPGEPALGITARFEAIAPVYPANPTVFVSEVLYNPGDTGKSGDWIELRNVGPAPAVTTGWILRDAEDDREFVLPESSIPAGGHLVLCEDIIRFRHVYPGVTNCVGDFRFGLNNSGDSVRLYEPSGAPVLRLDYDDVAPWPVEADGTGRSLELMDSSSFSTAPSKWRASPAVGGSPGVANP